MWSLGVPASHISSWAGLCSDTDARAGDELYPRASHWLFKIGQFSWMVMKSGNFHSCKIMDQTTQSAYSHQALTSIYFISKKVVRFMIHSCMESKTLLSIISLGCVLGFNAISYSHFTDFLVSSCGPCLISIYWDHMFPEWWLLEIKHQRNLQFS